MQIGQLNHLKYPSLGNQATSGNAADDAGATPSAAPQSTGRANAAQPATPAQDAVGVILKLQSDISAQPGVALAKDLVYSDGRQRAPNNYPDTDTRRMAEQHRQATERAASAPTQLAMNKDGVLVAKTAASGSEPSAPDFVTFAVKTMRDYAAEQEHQKAQTKESESTGSLIPHSLSDIQKLAARFKLFA